MISYSELIQRLFHINLFGGIKLGLQNCYRLQHHLNYPDRSFQSIHVAGTNGKGSVTTKIACGLQGAGYKVGLYTSPHISCFRERIKINGEMIPEQDVVSLLPLLLKLREDKQIPATFFELTTFLAFLYFAQEKVDFAVLETGLGGRLDATNVVSPLLSVITSISLDHTEVLGHTIEEITQEKAGIIKPFVPVIIGPRVPETVIQAKANQEKSPLFQVVGTFENYEQENQAIAKAALEKLSASFPLSQEAINQGLKGCQPCRFECLPMDPPVILDVAHNPDGLFHLFKAVRKRFPDKSIRVVFGLSKNKDIEQCLKIIVEAGTDFHLIEAPSERAAPVALLEKGLEEQQVNPKHLFINQTIEESVAKALQQARDHQQILVICGSFFIMSPVRAVLGIQETRDLFDMNERQNKQACTLGQ